MLHQIHWLEMRITLHNKNDVDFETSMYIDKINQIFWKENLSLHIIIFYV